MSSEQPTQIIGPAYLGTIQGVCKIVEIVSSFIAVLLVGINFYGWIISLFESAAAISIIFSAFLLIIYVTKLVEKIGVQWNKFQFFYHVVLAVYYIIAVGLVLHYGSVFSRIIGGGVLGIVAIIAHLVDSVDNYNKQPLC